MASPKAAFRLVAGTLVRSSKVEEGGWNLRKVIFKHVGPIAPIRAVALSLTTLTATRFDEVPRAKVLGSECLV